MRPSRSRDTSARPTTARVKTLLRAHVEWLRGVPLAVEEGAVVWLVLPSGREAARTIRVDRAMLSDTTRCVKELEREYPDALARVVGDVDRWQARVLAAVASLKPCVHAGAPLDATMDLRLSQLPTSLERRVRTALRDRRKRLVVDALVWAHALDPAPLVDLLERVDAHVDVLTRLWSQGSQGTETSGRLACLALLSIAHEDGDRAAPLFALLVEACAANAKATEEQPFVAMFPVRLDPQGTMVQVRARVETSAQLPGALARLIVWLGARDGRTRRAVLALVEVTFPRGLLRRWGDAHAELAAIDAELRTRAEWHPNAAILGRLRDVRKRMPPSWDVVEYVDDLCAPWGEVLAPLTAAIAALPESSALGRLRFLHHWRQLVVSMLDESYAKRVPAYLACFRAYVLASAGKLEVRLAPWKDFVFDTESKHRWHGVDYDLVEAHTPRRMERFFAALRLIRAPLEGWVLDLLSHVISVEATQVSPEEAAARTDALAERDEQLSRHAFHQVIRVANELGPESAKEFAALVIALSVPGVRALTDTWAAPGRIARLDADTRAWLRRTFVESPHVVAQWAHRIAFVAQTPLGVPAYPAADARELPRWARAYPSTLHAALARLAAVDADAEAAAERVLYRDLPSDASLQRQLDALEARQDVAAPAIAGRISALRKRLGTPRAVGAGRLANLAVKLDRAADRARWEAWSARVRDACAERIARLLERGECPSWALEDAHLQVITAAMRLRAVHRDLALRLLRVRASGPPWDLRDAPENVAVIRALTGRGIDLRPWIDGIPALEERAPDGAPIFVALEDDPLEIFQMGERFGTCLSIGAGNFFSVFANAADIDKRVVYARDPEGKPVARCLFALDDDGHLLTFHTYGHYAIGWSASIFARFAQTLAERMGTVCGSRGKVRARVAKEWYDDGPRDLVGQFPFLTRADFRQKLLESSPDAVIVYLAQAFAPRALDGLTLPLVFALPELRQRPELAPPLLALLLKQDAPLSDSLRLTTAELAHRAGDRELARRLAGEAVAAEIEQMLMTEPDHLSHALVELQLELDPSRVLAILRKVSRARGRTQDEASSYFAALALERLGRLRQALGRLQEIGRATSSNGGDVAGAIERIEARLRERGARRPR